MNKFLFILFFCCSFIYAQTDWARWEKADIDYAKQSNKDKRAYSISGNNLPETFIKSLASAYWFFISDLDGDNCPFHPSCSAFLIESVKETNLPQGVLMFFDRFTRDLNIFNRADKYPRIGTFHFYDPVQLYTLGENKINYLPPHKFIQGE
jgi:putative component of membrane protein insertase Oxa1/YidC/SpoIIIJ protein YidD